MTRQLNQGQREAVDAFFQFLFSDRKEFNLSGAAGVGKTYLMDYIIDEIMPRYFERCDELGVKAVYKSIVMTATTNKAAEVLSISTGRPCATVHSFFNLKVKPNFKTGETELIKIEGKWKVHDGLIIFVDECSMIDTALWKILQDGTINCKLVYVGDHCQLAPVAETLSPIYNQGSPFYRLTVPVRNAGQPALMDICDRMRFAVENGTFARIHEVPGVIDVLDEDSFIERLDAEFLDKSVSSRILVYKNQRVKDYGDHVRKVVRGLPDQYVEGERLVAASAYHYGKDSLSVEEEVTVLRVLGPDVINIEPGNDLAVAVMEIGNQFGSMTVRYPTDLKHYTKLLKHFKDTKQWRKFYFWQDIVADLRPAESCTVYKAQGSTYDSVYIDLDNISECTNPSQLRRMLYVAFSRARTQVFLFLGDERHASRYGGAVVRAPNQETPADGETDRSPVDGAGERQLAVQAAE